MRASSTGGAEEAEPETPAEAAISPAAVTMDDGGSDLTDRFKYKVRALRCPVLQKNVETHSCYHQL